MSGAAVIHSPVGRIAAVSNGLGLVAITFLDDGAPNPTAPPDRIAREAAAQLTAWFAGERREFDLPLAPRGTAFQREVWGALRTIPFGATTTYAEIAARIGRPSAVRAVGAANGANPWAIVVPCHRVIGRDGTLVGYAGGLFRKQSLLTFERSGNRLPDANEGSRLE